MAAYWPCEPFFLPLNLNMTSARRWCAARIARQTLVGAVSRRFIGDCIVLVYFHGKLDFKPVLLKAQ